MSEPNANVLLREYFLRQMQLEFSPWGSDQIKNQFDSYR